MAMTMSATALPSSSQKRPVYRPRRRFQALEFQPDKGCLGTGNRRYPDPGQSAPAKKASGVFARLLAAGERLMGVIRRNEGGANKDLAKFADQINALCDKWDR